MDFYRIREKSTKNGVIEIYPDFIVGRSTDLMIRGNSFYAIWDDERKIWSTDEYDVQRLVDQKLTEHRNSILKVNDGSVQVNYLSSFSSRSWSQFKLFMKNLSDNAHQLDEKLTFSNTEVKKKDYVSKRLAYPLEEGSIEAYEELISTLYDPEERAKLEWAIGAIIAGDAKYIQKFIVLYGEAGSGKSTILNIIQDLFRGYYTSFEAKALTSSSNAFSTEVFKDNPLVAIQHDGDLSRIEDNTKLNSIVSHEEITMNEKYKPSYTARVNSFLFMGTNKPVKITDAKSGIIRRLIDVKPSGRLVNTQRYGVILQQTKFELGAIAFHCLNEYRSMGKNYYSEYKPLDMILQTDIFYNFVEENFHVFKEQDGVQLTQAYDMYKTYCDDALIEYKLQRHKFREELRNYFTHFDNVTRVDGRQVRSYYSGFISEKFESKMEPDQEHQYSLTLDASESILDEIAKDYPAQYATANGVPMTKWDNVTTSLKDIDTNELHYVKLPKKHIVIDFDITDDNNNKSLELNIEAASKWPPTYAELSRSGGGIHLHYIYEGDTTRLSRIYDDEIEIKVFTGKSSLRRRLSNCNDTPVATINSGLPQKEEKMINFEAVQSEKSLRHLIRRNLNKEIHPGTAPSVDFIYKILNDAYDSKLGYDVTDLRPEIMAFANNSTNQALKSIKLVNRMKFKSEEPEMSNDEYETDDLVFFDVEVFPNLFVVVWKTEGGDPVRMINPTAEEIGQLLTLRLVGFNNRRYDNHILYARYIGYNNEQLYNLSQRIINNSRNATFMEAYGLSYADIYDFSSKKQSLSKFEIDLGINHLELGLPWDEPVEEELWERVVDYCVNDVEATEAVFKSREADFTARKILADLSGMRVNDTTQNHTAKIIFGNDKHPQKHFVYTDLSKEFPGYTFKLGKSQYRGEDPKEGGYVYSEPGMYSNVTELDIASMHPTSAIKMNVFGKYTKNYEDLMTARLAIKHGEYDNARELLDGKLKPYLEDLTNIKQLDTALKIVINIVYGLTSARFDNKFKDPKNIDNIIAKRGALFMIDLKYAVQEQGYTVAHIKTDSIKIPNATPEIIEFVNKMGEGYGYTFEVDGIYEKFCLVNNAVFIAKEDGEWKAVGSQFAHPYVYKTMFSKEKVEFKDLCETKSVTTSLYLDFNEELEEDKHEYQFVGKTGEFTPILPGHGGGLLMREKEGEYHAASGTKGYRWMESSMVKELGKEDLIDMSYFTELVDKAADNLSQYGDVEWFTE